MQNCTNFSSRIVKNNADIDMWKKSTCRVDFAHLEKSQNFAWIYSEDRIAVLVTNVFI